jgi:chemotaxis protein MotB
MKKTRRFSFVVAISIAAILLLPALSLYAGGSKALRQKLDECEEEVAGLESENSDLDRQIESKNAEIEKLRTDTRVCESEKRELEAKIAEYEELIAYWQAEIEAYGFEPEDPSVISRTVSETLAEKDARIVELERDVDAMERELEQLEMQLEIAKRKLEEAEREAEQLRIQTTLSERRVRDLEEDNEELLQALEVYEAIQEETMILMDIALDRIQYVLRDEIRRGEVRVFKGTLGITIDVVSAHMFDTGSVELTPAGRRILQKIAGLLGELDGYFIGVIGNADSRPIITPALKKKYPTNWELSSHRGATVVRFFLNNADIDPRRMVAMGLGEHQVIDRRKTEEGYGNNRRIDIVLLPIDAIAAVVIGAEVK